MKHKYSLKSIYSLILIVSAIIILIVQFCVFQNLFRQVKDERNQKINNYISSTANVFSTNIDEILEVQNTLSKSPYLINYLLGNDTDNNKQNFKSTLMTVKSFSNINFNVAIYDKNEHKIAFDLPGIDVNLFNSTDFFSDYKSTSKKIFFYKPETSALDEIYITMFTPIFISNTAEVKMNHIGTLTTTSKINLIEIGNILSFDKNLEIYLENKSGEKLYIKHFEYDISNPTTLIKPVKNTDWQFVGHYKFTYTDSKMFHIIIVFIVETIMVLLLLAIQQIVSRKLFNKPINDISKFLNNYLITKKETQIKSQKTSELDELVNCINKMLKKNELLSREILQNQTNMYEKELEEKNTILYALQAQINPHFLYNTLDCIKSIAYVKDVPEIKDMSIALANIIRYSIREKVVVKVQDELKILQEYFSILEIRHGNRFDFSVNINKELADKYILKMIFQPIVENSVNYNQARIGSTKIVIDGVIEENCLLFTVSDNGIGIPKEKLEILRNDLINPPPQIVSTSHIGLRNINSRIKLYFGCEYGISIDSVEGEYTKIFLKLPENIDENFILADND